MASRSAQAAVARTAKRRAFETPIALDSPGGYAAVTALRSARAALDAILSTQEEGDGEAALELQAGALQLVRVELTLDHLGCSDWSASSGERSATPFEAIARIHVAADGLLGDGPAAEVANEIEAVLDSCPVPDPWPLGIAIETLILTDRFAVAEAGSSSPPPATSRSRGSSRSRSTRRA